jgi:hypothetical protein
MADMEEMKKVVLQVMEKKQKRMMMKDLLKEVQKIDPSIEKRPLKKATSEMITNDGTLAYWSSGSTTYFALPGGKHAEGED